MKSGLPGKEYLNWFSLGLGALLFLLLIWLNPFALEPKGCRVVAVAILMITWWITEAIPMAAVALLPLILFPLLGIATISETASPYANEVIFLFMGGFLIGLGMEKWNLHKRIALNIVKRTGTSGNRIILGFILATAFLSMWLSNTATTMMMFPIALSVIHVVSAHREQEKGIRNFSLCIMLSIAYASNIGGISTIIGTPPNVAYVAYIRRHYQYEIAFSDWMLLCTPIAILLLFFLHMVMVKWLYPNHLTSSGKMKDMIQTEVERLGPITLSEKRVLFVFCTTACLWIFRSLISRFSGLRLDDSMIAVFGALLMFILPSGRKREGESEKLLMWSDTSKMAWGILLLFGGGITLANGMEKAGLIDKLGAWIAGFGGSNQILLIIVIATISVFMSEVMSNIAQVIVITPVVCGIADAMGINPFLLGIPMTLGASCASMLPMGTPPNAIVFASGLIRMKQMVRVGFVLNLISIVVITLFSWLLLPKILAPPH